MRIYWPAIVTAMMTCHAGISVAADAVGRVMSTTGSSQLVRNGQSQPMPPGSSIVLGDNFATGDGSLLELNVVDSSTLVLGSNTRMQLTNFRRDPDRSSVTQTVLDLGRGSLNVSTNRNGDPTVMVVTPLASVSIAGGQAGVFFDPDKNGAGLIVRNDNARVSITYNGRAILVPAGESVQIQPNGSVVLLPNTSPDLQNLPVFPRIDSANPRSVDGANIELRVEPAPSTTPTPATTATPTPTPGTTVTPTPTTAPTPTPTGIPGTSPTPQPSVPPTTPVTLQPTPTVTAVPSTPPNEPTPTDVPAPTLTPPPPTATPTPVSPF